ncbi:MAG: glycosyltransferase family 2 protein [Oligoflexia bacterium]|nr:glycosyltransferase family 2 protein [Oligoflexia bacterium]
MTSKPRLSGFTLVRNGEKFQYPYLESLRSLLPLVDELVINVGRGEDETLGRVQEFARAEGQGKVVLFESDWPLDDPEKRKGGLILSEQTNLALERCTGDWCFYLQADEVLHEEDAPRFRQALERAHGDPAIEGLLFDYVHFYGSFDVVQVTRSAYRREVRVVRRASGARSVGDAQSFRKGDGSKLRVARAQARVFHYGWVRPPEAMKEKTFFMDQLYHGKPDARDAATGTPHTGENYRYKRIWGLRPFRGSHPRVMGQRIASQGWSWDLANSPFVWSWRDAKKIVLDLFERATGIRLFEYRSYRLHE